MSFQRFKGEDGNDVVINVAHVMGVTSAYSQSSNGHGPKTLILGKCLVMMVNGTQYLIEGSVTEIYGKLRRDDSKLSLVENGN